jgi:integrase
MGSPGRPPLPIGSHGEINVTTRGPSRFEATARFRHADGVTRPVSRTRKSPTAAKTALRKAMAELTGDALSGEVNRSTRLAALAEVYFAEQERLAAQGSKQMTTVDQYRDHYRRHIDKAMGQLQLCECTVSAVHRFLVKLAGTSSSSAVMCRKVLSGMLGYAVIHRALPANPVRDAGRIKRQAKRPARALEAEQITDWLAKLDESEVARAWDLPDLSRFLLATGLRLGEALAVSWAEVDFEGKSVTVAWRVVTVKGQGTVRHRGVKTDPTGEQAPPRLDLPQWAVTMLKRRKLLTGGRGEGWTAADSPVFPQVLAGGWRDPREVGKRLREVRGDLGYPWLTSHSLGRKTVATILDEGGATARQIADQLNHARPSMTQDVYMARRRSTSPQAAILEKVVGA